jgi:hypothetical protein
MSERKTKPLQAPESGPQQASSAKRADAFQRAENLLAAGNENKDERSREALAGIENRPARDRAHKLTPPDALTQTADRNAEDEADEKVDKALNEQAREAGVEAAEDSSRSEWGLTPHNI